MRLLCIFVNRNMKIIVPPHPTPPHSTPPVTDHERGMSREHEGWWGCCACVCTGTWTLLSRPHPTPPHPTSNWSWKSCACVCRRAEERYCPTPPHPTPPVTDHERAAPVSAGKQERWWGCCACVHTGTWMLVCHPTPPHPTSNWSWKSSACVCTRAGRMIRLRCLRVHRNMIVIVPPRFTPPRR